MPITRKEIEGEALEHARSTEAELDQEDLVMFGILIARLTYKEAGMEIPPELDY